MLFILIREIVKIILLIEIIGGLIFTFYIMRFYDSFNEAFLNGLFMSVSATTNAGFDITGESLMPYFNDYFIQIVTMLLIILGNWFSGINRSKGFFLEKNSTFSFFIIYKNNDVTFGVLLVFGAVMIFILESFNSFKGMAWHEKIFTSLFHSVSSRSAGLTTFDVTQFSEATDIVH